MNNMCPVCGFGLDFPPDDFRICPCCGTEFGYDDAFRKYADLRKQWLRDGANWWSESEAQPPEWDPYEQINYLLAKPDFYSVFVGTGIQAKISGNDYQGKVETDTPAEFHGMEQAA